MVIPLVEGRGGVTEVAVPLVVGGRADLIYVGDDDNDTLILSVGLSNISFK